MLKYFSNFVNYNIFLSCCTFSGFSTKKNPTSGTQKFPRIIVSRVCAWPHSVGLQTWWPGKTIKLKNIRKSKILKNRITGIIHKTWLNRTGPLRKLLVLKRKKIRSIMRQRAQKPQNLCSNISRLCKMYGIVQEYVLLGKKIGLGAEYTELCGIMWSAYSPSPAQ